MDSLQTKIEEQLQLFLEFLHHSIIMLKYARTDDNSYLSIKVKHVEKGRLSLKLHMYKGRK
jgi:hypothetical protein